MQKRLSPIELVQLLAEKTGVPPEQVKAVLQAQAELAYLQAGIGFRIPGLGLFTAATSAAREMVMRFGPRAGEKIKIPEKKRLKFRVSRIAKDAVLGQVTELPDLFADHTIPDLAFSNSSTPVDDTASILKSFQIDVLSSDTLQRTKIHRLPDLNLPSGKIIGCDPYLAGGASSFELQFRPGSYPLFVAVCGGFVALAIVRFKDVMPNRWEPSKRENSEESAGHVNEYGVDSATGSLGDPVLVTQIANAEEDGMDMHDQIIASMSSEESEAAG